MTTNGQINCPTCKGKKKIVKIAAVKNPSPVDYCDGQGYEIPCPDCCAKLDEQKCPVCGEGMIGVEEQEPYPYEFTCINPDCAILGEYRVGTIAQLEKQIQSRIDKEKAAAVQEERERVIKEIKDNITLSELLSSSLYEKISKIITGANQ